MDPQARTPIAPPSQTREEAEPAQAEAALQALADSALLSRAAELARAGKLDEARALVQPLVSQPSPSLAALDLLAKISAQQGRFEDARSLWRQALERSPHDESFRRAVRRCDYALDPWPASRPARIVPTTLVFALALAVVAVVVAGEWVFESQLRSLQAQTLAIVSRPLPTPAPAPQPSEPTDLAARVSRMLRAGGVAQSVGLRVSADDGGVVLLAGTVPNLSTRYHLERLAARVPGVKAVDVTNLALAKVYQVKRGDSLSSVSLELYGTTYYRPELARVNHLQPPYYLHPGELLVVPEPNTKIGP